MIRAKSLGILQTWPPDKAPPDGAELVTAVYRRALRDARAKCPKIRADAIEFLDVTAPGWREQLRERGRL